MSTYASGPQQIAQNLYAESTFVCPSYWLASAFSSPPRRSYKYQYSVIPAEHAGDLPAFFGPPAPNQEGEFSRATMMIWGNFVTKGGDPSIPAEVAGGERGVGEGGWNGTFPRWEESRPQMVDLNTTGGEPYVSSGYVVPNTTAYGGPGVRNDFRVVDADAWEGGRGERCEVWRRLGPGIVARGRM